MITERFIHNGEKWVIVRLENATHILPEKEWKWIENKFNKDNVPFYDDDNLLNKIDFDVFDSFRVSENCEEEGIKFEL